MPYFWRKAEFQPTTHPQTNPIKCGHMEMACATSPTSGSQLQASSQSLPQVTPIPPLVPQGPFLPFCKLGTLTVPSDSRGKGLAGSRGGHTTLGHTHARSQGFQISAVICSWPPNRVPSPTSAVRVWQPGAGPAWGWHTADSVPSCFPPHLSVGPTGTPLCRAGS